MGKKYIVEIGRLERLYKAFVVAHGKPSLTWLSPEVDLTPYTEPDLGLLAKENFERGYRQRKAEDEKDIEQVREEAYQQGLSDAWEAARKIGSNSMCSLKEMGFDFSQCAVPDYNPSWFVVKNYSASEAIEKIRQYEQEKRFCVGDEFENESGKRFVILKMDGTEIDRYIDEEGKTYCMIAKYKVMRKTGRHFPEIAEVLQKMKES